MPGASERLILGNRAGQLSIYDVAGGMERHFEAISAYLGSSAPPAPIDYYKFASVEELQSARACSLAQSPACVHGGQVRSAKLFDAHELIHAYVADSRPPWIFIEGLADALSCGYGPWSRPRDHANLDDVSALAWQDLAAWVPSGDVTDLTLKPAKAAWQAQPRASNLVPTRRVAPFARPQAAARRSPQRRVTLRKGASSV